MNDAALVSLLVGVAQIASILGGGAFAAYRIGSGTARIEGAMEALAKHVEGHGDDIRALQSEVSQMNRILIEMAVHKERIDSISQRIQLLDSRYEELRHGEGFVSNMFPRDK